VQDSNGAASEGNCDRNFKPTSERIEVRRGTPVSLPVGRPGDLNISAC